MMIFRHQWREMMVPAPNDPRWQRVLTSENDIAQASLATKILITRLRRETKAAPGNLNAAITELRGYLEKNAFAQADIAHF